MGWSIAQAKQRLSEVVRLAAREPQPLYNRGRLVGALIDAESYQAFERWRSGTSEATVARQFDVLRAQLAAQAPSGTGPAEPLPAPARIDRPNAFARMLEEQQTPAGPGRDDATG
jgi:hypothetical protein